MVKQGSKGAKDVFASGINFSVVEFLVNSLTLMYIFATPVLPSDAGVAFSIINFATPLTQNPRGGWVQ